MHESQALLAVSESGLRESEKDTTKHYDCRPQRLVGDARLPILRVTPLTRLCESLVWQGWKCETAVTSTRRNTDVARGQ